MPVNKWVAAREKECEQIEQLVRCIDLRIVCGVGHMNKDAAREWMLDVKARANALIDKRTPRNLTTNHAWFFEACRRDWVQYSKDVKETDPVESRARARVAGFFQELNKRAWHVIDIDYTTRNTISHKDQWTL